MDTQLLRAALIGFQYQRGQIDAKIAEIQRRIGDGVPASAVRGTVAKARKEKPRLNAAARRRIAAAQKKRWAAFHEQQQAAQRNAEPVMNASPKRATKKNRLRARKPIARPASKNVAAKKARGKRAIKKAAVQTAGQAQATP